MNIEDWKTVKEGDIIWNMPWRTDPTDLDRYKFIRQTDASVWVCSIWDDESLGEVERLLKSGQYNPFFKSVEDCYNSAIQSLEKKQSKLSDELSCISDEIDKHIRTTKKMENHKRGKAL